MEECVDVVLNIYCKWYVSKECQGCVEWKSDCVYIDNVGVVWETYCGAWSIRFMCMTIVCKMTKTEGQVLIYKWEV